MSASPKKKLTTVNDRSKKGDGGKFHPHISSHRIASKQFVDDLMDEDESNWADEQGPSGSRPGGEEDEDENMDESDHHDEDDDDDDEMDDMPAYRNSGTLSNAYERLARLAAGSGLHLDEATAQAIFGGEFRGFGSMLSGMTNRFKKLKAGLQSRKMATRLTSLRECSELLLVSNEDSLGGSFQPSSFATEFIAILNGKPNFSDTEEKEEEESPSDDMDEDAQLAAALAMSSGGVLPTGESEQDEMEAQLLACRCLAHMMEALPGSGHTLVSLGAVPALCAKLNEINYIELAEQTLSVSITS